jgi:hypothetical protein
LTAGKIDNIPKTIGQIDNTLCTIGEHFFRQIVKLPNVNLSIASLIPFQVLFLGTSFASNE